MRKRTLAGMVVVACLLLAGRTGHAVQFNPQEVAMVVENFLADQDATTIGLITAANGTPHMGASTIYRSSHIGPHVEARPSEPVATRQEWQAWRGEQRASVGGDDYVIEYRGYMLDTRVVETDDPTYNIRWESTWYKNDPSRTTPYAEGAGGFKFTDPDFNFDIEVDPFNPNNVTLSGGASTKLWGVVDVSISGSKNFGTGILTAQAGVSADIPVVSDFLGPVASADFTFTYNQKTGAYESTVEATALFFFSTQATVNKGKVVAPAVAQVPMPAMPMYIPPPNAGSVPVQLNMGLDGPEPLAMPVMVAVPGVGTMTGATTFEDAYDPFGSLADELLDLAPNNFTVVNQLVHHPGFLDPVTFPTLDDPTIPLGGGLAFSFMDPAAGLISGAPPGITLAPIEFNPIPEPTSAMLLVLALGATVRRRARRA